MSEITRRKFVALTTTGLAAAPFALRASSFSASITAQEVADRITKGAGGDWSKETVDGFKAGDPSTPVTGIATTALASMDVLAQAVKAGANLIITSEPTYFSKADTPTPPVRRFPGGAGGRPGAAAPPPPATPPPPAPPDPVFTAKSDFIKKHNLVVWRFADHWRVRTPDPFALGIDDALGWSKLVSSGDPKHISVPEISLDALASRVKASMKLRGGIRVVGDPQLRIRKIALLPGSTPIQASIEALPGVDAIIAGEVREWETVEYVRDTVDLGGKKGLILVGRIMSENPGMQVCAQWLKTIVPEVKTTWLPIGDPYWRPIL